MSDDQIKNGIETTKSAVELVGAIIKVAGDHPDVKASGTNLAKSARTLTAFINVALLPIAAVNYGYEKARSYFQEEFSGDIEAAAVNIPQINLQEPPPSIAGPALQGLAFTHDDDNLREMYLNLIASAMDNRFPGKAHPAFAEIIRQLSGDEAGLLLDILRREYLPIIEIRLDTYDEKYQNSKLNFPINYKVTHTHILSLSNDDGTPYTGSEIAANVDNWIRLGLVNVDYSTAFTDDNYYSWGFDRPEYKYWVPQDSPPHRKVNFAKGQLKSTAFGKLFASAVGEKSSR